MRKRTWFPLLPYEGWPRPQDIESYFLTSPGRKLLWNRADSYGFRAIGVDGTEQLELGKGRVDTDLAVWANLKLGMLLIHSKLGGGHREVFSSVGNTRLLHEWTRSRHNTPLPIGLFIPFEKAWSAVREFLETDGKLPKSIEWISNHELPPNTFPDP